MGLAGVLDLPDSDPKLAGLAPVGWYHSHHRSEIFLSADDLQLYNDFFPERWQIAMVLRPADLHPTRAGFFFRDRWGDIKSDAPVQEFIIDSRSYGLTLLGPAAEKAVAQILAARVIPADVPKHDVTPGHLTLVPRPTGLAAPATNGSTAAAAKEEAVPAFSKTSPRIETAAKRDIERDDEPERPAIRLAGFDGAEAKVGSPPPTFGFGGTLLAPETRQDFPQGTVRKQAMATAAKGEFPQWTGWRSRWKRFFQQLTDSERRSAKRESGDGLVAFYWDGNSPRPHRVRDISMRGAFVETDFTWMCGTQITITLQIASNGHSGNGSTETFVVPAEVVRTSSEGMGLRFPLRTLGDPRKLLHFLTRWNPNSAHLSLENVSFKT
jgi:hypothetical protein